MKLKLITSRLETPYFVNCESRDESTSVLGSYSLLNHSRLFISTLALVGLFETVAGKC